MIVAELKILLRIKISLRRNALHFLLKVFLIFKKKIIKSMIVNFTDDRSRNFLHMPIPTALTAALFVFSVSTIFLVFPYEL